MNENDGAHFKQVLIPIRDERFFREDFYFRFYNYASIVSSSLPANRSNEDNWNIDFVYLNLGRSVNDTTYPMLTFSGQRPSFFERYQAIPYRQYRINPNSAIRENLHIDIANLDGVDHQANYYYSVQQVGGSQHYTRALEPSRQALHLRLHLQPAFDRLDDLSPRPVQLLCLRRRHPRVGLRRASRWR